MAGESPGPHTAGDPLQPEQIVSQRERLRELARRLVADDDRAEDLVQETVLAALRGAHATGRSPAGWLSELLRLKARDARRSERRRAVRERSAPALEDLPARGSDRERDALLGTVAEEVERLDEPYRSALSLRFLEELPPREIAARLEVPARTVYTRIARGLKQLRERLDKRLGALVWIPALAELGGGGAPDAAGPLARVARAPASAGARAWVALAVVSTAGLLWFGLREPEGGRAAIAARRVARSPAPAPTLTALEAPDPPPETRSAPVADAAPRRDALPTTLELTGSVVDLSGHPVAGVPVHYQHATVDSQETGHLRLEPLDATPDATSGEDGSFSIRVPPLSAGRILAQSRAWQPVLAEMGPAAVRVDPLRLVVAPTLALTGVVLDGAGSPIAGAEVIQRPSEELVASVQRPERTWSAVRSTSHSDATGRFRLVGAYAMDRSRLVISHPGHVARTILLGPETERDLVVRLEAEETAGSTLAGVVVTAGGRPAQGCLVVAGSSTARTGPDGKFELVPRDLDPGATIWALAPGCLPAQHVVTTLDGGGLNLPDELLLRLGGPPPSIEGVAVDDQGFPMHGVRVWCMDPTATGPDMQTWFVEPRMDPTGEWDSPFIVLTDLEGRFRLPYLLQRPYRVGAVMFPSLLSVTSAPVAAGTSDLVLRVPTDREPLRMAGRVVSRHGEPLEGVKVTLVRELLSVALPRGRSFVGSFTGKVAWTDAEGRFDLFPAYAEEVELRLERGDLVEIDLPLPAEDDLQDLLLVAPRRVQLRVTRTAGAPEADRLALLDSAGAKLRVLVPAPHDSGYGVVPTLYVPLAQGRSPVVVAPDTCEVLLLYRGSEVVERVPVDLSVGGINELEL